MADREERDREGSSGERHRLMEVVFRWAAEIHSGEVTGDIKAAVTRRFLQSCA